MSRAGLVATGQRDTGAATARRILWGLLVCAAASALSVAFLDRPIASAVHAWVRQPGSLSQSGISALTQVPNLHIALAIILVVVLGLARLNRRGPHHAAWSPAHPGRADLRQVGFLASLAVVVAEAIKTTLKFAFGRTWPETWVRDNPSFIRDGVYGFFPFHGGMGWGAFPSGHTTAVLAAATVLWLLWPRWRAVYALVVALAVLGLLGMNYHFLADIMAGAYLGWATGLATVRMGSPR